MNNTQTNNTNNLERMLTLEEVMENLHIKSKTTMLKLLKVDSFPYIKIGSIYAIPESEYKKWLKKVLNTEITL